MEIINEIFKTYGTTIGLIIVFVIIVIFCSKIIIEKMVENVISSKYSKKVADYENSIYKKTMAYKIMLEKELNYYDIYFSYASTLVTDIQDVSYVFNKRIKGNDDIEKLKHYLLHILEIIPKLKRDTILYECYCDEKVKTQITKLIVMLQDDFLKNIEIFIKNPKRIRKQEIIKICDSIVMQLAMISVTIQEREKLMVEQ